MAGNATNCEFDEECDSVMMVPNVNHTACGMFQFQKDIFFLLEIRKSLSQW